MLLSVIINTYRRPAALAGCLAALARSEGAAPLETLVVDDGGGDAALEDFEKAYGESLALRLIRIPHAGRAGARNRGVAEARGERVLFLGDDVFVEPQTLARHRARAERLTAVLGPYPMARLKGSPPFLRWAEPNPQHEIADAQNAGFWFFATGNLSMDRSLFLELGGFDTRFEVYGWEDIDLGLRFERAGGRLIYDPQARAVHDHPPLTRAQLWRREREMGTTAWQFHEKWATAEPRVAAKMRFWDDPAALRPGPAWRRRLGDGLVALLDRIAPASALNGRLYERMIFAHRLAGVAEAWRRTQGVGPAWEGR